MTEQNAPWRPLRERIAGVTGDRALVQGTPPYLLGPLQRWLYDVLIARQFTDTLTSLELKLRKPNIALLSQGTPVVLPEGYDLLEAIDATLHLHSWVRVDQSLRHSLRQEWWGELLARLSTILDQGGSVWAVKEEFDGLTTRVDDTVARAVRATISDAKGDASHHLRKAWDAAYGFHPDPTLAYSEAVKAVEAITIPAVLPRDRDATLGKVLGELKNTRARWTVAIDDRNGQSADGEAVIALIALLWHGQRDRHAGPSTKLATLEVAQMAVHSAATLVQWFTAGAVRKQPQQP